MRFSLPLTALLAATLAFSNLHANEAATLLDSDFDDGANPPTGWITDYEWSGNTYYIGNKNAVGIIAQPGRGSVVQLKPPKPDDGGAKMESLPFAIEPGFRYKCTLDVKGGPSRVYFAGYRWAPGVRPNDQPAIQDLRMIYKSKAANTPLAADWTSVSLEFPGVALSPDALKHLKQVRFMTLYIWFMNTGSVDNIVVTKTPDPTVQF